MLRWPVLVLAAHVEVHLLIVAQFLGRCVVSRLLRLIGCFGRWLLQWTVAAFSTFSLVTVVLGVQRVLAGRVQVELLPGLESLSQSSVSAMVGLVVVLKSFVGIETVLWVHIEKVSDRWTL